MVCYFQVLATYFCIIFKIYVRTFMIMVIISSFSLSLLFKKYLLALYVRALRWIIKNLKKQTSREEKLKIIIGNINQNHNEISYHTCQNGHRQKTTNNQYCCEDVQKRESLYPVGGNVNWSSHCTKQRGIFLKKLKIELPYDLAIPLLGIYPKKQKH